MIEILKRIIVSCLVLSGEYREKRCQKHTLEKEGGEEEGNEECRMSDDLHDRSILSPKASLKKGLMRVYYKRLEMALF